MVWVFILYLALAILLFYLVNWIGEHSKPLDLGYVQMSVGLQEDTAPLFNYLFKVLAPVVYIILLAVLFQSLGWDILNKRIFWVVVFYWCYRFLFITVRGQLPLLNWVVQIIYWISSIGLAYWVNTIIDEVGSVLPDPKTLLDELWILVILFLYSIFNKMEFSRSGAERRIKKYTYRKYEQFRALYGEIVDAHFTQDYLKAAIYAIMVYEDFNRPKIARTIERGVGRFSKTSHTYGVMQVMSTNVLTDEESVLLAIDKIKRDIHEILERGEIYCYEDGRINVSSLVYRIFGHYNPGDINYSGEVNQVYENLVEKYYEGLPSSVMKEELHVV